MDESRGGLLSSRQLGLLLWAGMVSPVIRQIPGSMTGAAGNAAWVSALLCVPAAALLGWFPARMLRSRRPGEGLGEVLCRALGPFLGRAIAGLFGLWFVFYAGFVLRAGADRFVSAMYPESRDWVFMGVMGLLTLTAGAGRVKVLARCAQIIAPVLWAVFALVFVFCVQNVDFSELRPAGAGAAAVCRGSLPMLCALSVGAFPSFLAGETEPGPLYRCFVLSLLTLAGLGTALCLATVGTFGPELAGQMRYPFFVMLRGIRIFDLLERVEALIVVQWAAADFLLLGTLVHLAVRCLTLAVRGTGKAPDRRAALSVTAGAFICGRLCASSAFALRDLGRELINPVNGILVFGLLPLCFAVGKLRRRL